VERSKTITFDPPLAFENAKVAEITLRVPRGGELLAAEKLASETPGAAGPRVADALLISLVAGISLGFVADMDEAKRKEATAFIDSFSTAPPEGTEPNLAPDLQLPIVPPITMQNTTYDVLDLRPPKSGELDAAYAQIGTATNSYTLRKFQIMLVARVSGFHRGVIERLEIDQLNEASRYLMGFT
jgi:hypothetical protein